MGTDTMKFVKHSESAHWYLKDGTPFYTVPNKSKPGTERNATMTDAKKVGAGPSVSGILDGAAKPGLVVWKLNQMLLASMTLPEIPGEPLEDRAERVVEDHNAHSKSAMQLGTDLHAAVQQAYENEPFDAKFAISVAATKSAVAREFPGVTDWECETSFYHTLGYGGKVDMHSRSARTVIDFKSKAFNEADIKKGLAYDEHASQLSAYAFGLKIEGPIVANVFISTTVPGLVHVHKWTDEDRRRGLEMFMLLQKLWVLTKRYNPALT